MTEGKIGDLTSRNWFGKAAAGTVLGFMLALGLTGIFAWFGPGEVGFFSVEAQFTMWMMSPIWALILSFCFLFRTGLSAWIWLGAANLVVWGLLYGSEWLAG